MRESYLNVLEVYFLFLFIYDFFPLIFSIESCDNLCKDIYNFGSVSCMQCIVIKPPSKLINFPFTKITIIRVIESLVSFKFFLEDLFTFLKYFLCVS